MILVRVGFAAFGAFLAAFSALFAAALAFVLTLAFGATLRTLGATRFGFLLLIGLSRSLGHRDREGSQQEGEQHDEYSALSGFHFCSPIQMITVRTPAHTGIPCETLASKCGFWRKFFKSGKRSSEDMLDHDSAPAEQ